MVRSGYLMLAGATALGGWISVSSTEPVDWILAEIKTSVPTCRAKRSKEFPTGGLSILQVDQLGKEVSEIRWSLIIGLCHRGWEPFQMGVFQLS